jgi:predicted DNA-binding helix-hairpin-helix protein
MGICHSYTPDGRCVSLLKILLTNFCIYDCQYCINRISSDTARARFTPAEVVRLTLDFYKRNYIEGLFLSSGVIKSPDYTMEQLIEVARTLREVHGFQGYLHLKAVPGASKELIDGAGRYADRLSANIELPTEVDLKKLAPEKSFAVTGETMREISTRVEQSKDELAPPEHPDLSLEMDPKLAWALRRREVFPVDVNRAPREHLLRVPGMGVRTVDRLLRIRRWHRITIAEQLSLFTSAHEALTGEL